jgi:hypothetical protein
MKYKPSISEAHKGIFSAYQMKHVEGIKNLVKKHTNNKLSKYPF